MPRRSRDAYLKVTGAFAEYRELEVRMQAAICSRFGLPPEEPDCVKRVDKAMVAHRDARLAGAVAPGLGRSDLSARHHHRSPGSADRASIFPGPLLRVAGRLRTNGKNAARCGVWAHASRGGISGKATFERHGSTRFEARRFVREGASHCWRLRWRTTWIGQGDTRGIVEIGY